MATSYSERYASGWARWKHERKVALLRRWLAGADSVLAVACGSGRFHEVALDASRVGVDLSRPMLREHLRQHRSARLVNGDASRLPFADGSFDTVLCMRFLSHLRDAYRARVLHELVRVARRQVILDGRHRYNLRFASRWIRRRLGLAHADKLRHSYGQFREELEAAGLRVQELRSIAWGLSARFVVRAEKA